jgi:hypothetical protein
MQSRILIALLLAVTLAGLQAGFMKIWQFEETAAAPVLVVGRVLAIQKGERVPESPQRGKAETRSMTAEIQVLRSHSLDGETLAVEKLKVHFLAYGPTVTQFDSGYPPPLPAIKPGQVLILPLKENKNPESETWELTADSGVDLTIPARAEMADLPPAKISPSAFLSREIANVLSEGTPQELSAIANYLQGQQEDLTSEIMPLLQSAIGDNQPRWAEVATSLLAAQGIPRPTVKELLTAKVERKSLLLPTAALRRLTPSPETETLLIKTWIANAPWNAWGSANSLIEYANNPTTTETLRQALQSDLAGSSYIAWTLQRNGNQANLQEALARALRVADQPQADSTDLQGAAALLRDYGSDQDLKHLAALVRKYQTESRTFYSVLWQYATEEGNPREARVLAVVLQDRRIVYGETRYCDFALGVLERAVNQHFGSEGKTLKERDEAVVQALTWLKSKGLAD